MIKFCNLFVAIFFFSGIHAGVPGIVFKENKGQWPVNVLFGSETQNCKYYLTKTGFQICVYGKTPDHSHLMDTDVDRLTLLHDLKRKHHIYEVNFVGSQFSKTNTFDQQNDYYNYFLGNDKNKWAGHVKAYGKVEYLDLYPKTNLIVYSSSNNFKYDFELKPGADISKIKMNYTNSGGISIVENKLIIKTKVGEVKEYEPYAYQLINGTKKPIECNYVLLDNNTVGFTTPNGYNKNFDLIIDPTVIVCSYSGSSVWSNCMGATYDANGNIFVFGYSDSGYPTDTLSLQDTANGSFDIILTKYNPSGSVKFFSTYLGGGNYELPQSVIVNNYGIYLFSQTSSTNFPVTINAFDTTFNGGLTDLAMSRLNLTGSSLLASTYIGGNSGDGTNDVSNAAGDNSTIGNFVMDGNGNSYCVSASTSTSFPVTASAFQSVKKGVSDAVAFKLDSTLSNLIWCTYIGGTNSENGMGIRLDGSGGVYISGSTFSNNFPTTAGVIQPTDLASTEMYVAHINNTGTGLIASTYLGTSGGDWGYFMDMDSHNDIYLCGYLNTATTMTATPGVYSSSLGKNTIYKLNSSLTTLYYKTKFGTQISGSNGNITYSAFEVDSCQNIYIAGTTYGNYMPLSPDALQSVVKGNSDLYFAVFRNNMSSLGYGTYFGGIKDEHVDGGISNFTKRGMLYQGICNQGYLPVTSNAYSTVDSTFVTDSTYYNDGFVKIDFQTFINAGSSYGANITGCPPFTPTFVSTTNTGAVYWDLGNGITSVKDTISTTYTNLGSYNVLLIVTDTNTCNRYDSIKTILNVVNPPVFDIGEDVLTCLGVPALVKSNTSAITYSWSSGQTSPNIMALPGTYTLTINNGGCNSSDIVNVVVGEQKLAERFPNVVTPNEDGVNDLVEFKKYNFEEVEFILYDRWGKERFKTSSPAEEWRPKDLNDGTYFYVVNYKSSCTGKHAQDKGFISIFK